MNHRHLLKSAQSIVVCACLVASTMATALDDGGGRSIFADGAGNRALGLGGAYVAIADDASAVLWNPGGLGFIQRYEVQASHTDLIGFGFSEQYAALVIPSWRLGVLALSFRQFGVSGIEQRDSRNVLLDDDLSDRENELSLSYGYQLGRAWSVGGSAKMRRHELAGISDSGFGLDLGLKVKPLVAAGSENSWAEDITVGLAVRNAIEPTLRLVEDSVPDPRGIRGGVAYQRTLGRQSRVLATVDVEKTSDMDTRLHAGLEAQIMPLLALRAGTNDGTLVAGTSLRWQDYGVNYVFEDLDPTDIHRIGVSFQFGGSRDERRLADLNAREETLQRRLNSALVDQSRQRMTELRRQTETALRGGDLKTAAESLAMLKVIEPDSTQILPLETAIYRGQAKQLEAAGDLTGATLVLGQALNLDPEDAQAAAMLARVQSASDHAAARSAAIRERLDRAMDAFAGGQLLAAQRGFQSVLAEHPRDAEAAAMLQRTKIAIQRRTDDLIDQARLLTNGRQYAAAAALLSEARQLSPDSRELAVASRLLTDAKVRETLTKTAPVIADTAAVRPAVATGSATAKPPTPKATVPAGMSAERREEIAALYQSGMDAVEQGSVVEAMHYWEIVWQADPKYQKVSEYLKQQYLSRGMTAFVAGQLEDAISSWESAVRVAPDDERARGYLARANEQLSVMRRMDQRTP